MCADESNGETVDRQACVDFCAGRRLGLAVVLAAHGELRFRSARNERLRRLRLRGYVDHTLGTKVRVAGGPVGRIGPLVSALLLLSVSACVEVGRNFVRPDPESIALKKTTRTEIVQRFGQPWSTGQFSKNSQLVDSMHYFYGKQEGGTNWLYKKHCWFYLLGDELVGFLYVTGFPAEQRNFDARSVPAIVKGKTTKAEVLALFGQPQGVLQFPMTDEKKTTAGDSSIVYAYHQRSGVDRSAFVDKFLEVFFDANGIVKDVDLDVSQKNASSGGRAGRQTDDP